jgi:hypothetical protein
LLLILPLNMAILTDVRWNLSVFQHWNTPWVAQ